MPPILILSGCIITTNICGGSPYSEFKMDGFAEPSQVIANGLPALEGMDVRQQKPQFEHVTFLRSSRGGYWLYAASERYKLVVSGGERAWLMDL